MDNKKCKKCGRELPISEFKPNHLSADGFVGVCNACSAKKLKKTRSRSNDEFSLPGTIQGGNPDLASFSPRELMAELKVRGYRGKLSIVREIVL